MKDFLLRYASFVTGVLSGFDRLWFRGSLRMLSHCGGMCSFLRIIGVSLAQFKQYVQEVTRQIRQATEQLVVQSKRPLIYLESSAISKEQTARKIAQEDGIREGLICVFSCVEPCYSYTLRPFGGPTMTGGLRKCLHYYHYFQHPVWGFGHARLQTWFPMNVHVCLNGRECLARRMDREGLAYVRRENCFTSLADVQRAQVLADEQLHMDWKLVLDEILKQINPMHKEIFHRCSLDYYWSVEQSEWATDVMFKSSRDLAHVYPALVNHGIQHLGSRDVMRFLGRKVPVGEAFHNHFDAEVVSELNQRKEGIRIRHRINENGVKMYDKQGSVLRVETTLVNPREMKVFRPKEGDKQGKKDWRYMRKGIADLYRRAQVSQGCNQRYLQSMATVRSVTPLKDLMEPLCKRVRWKGAYSRGLNPLASDDVHLLESVSRGEFAINGFRNRDIRQLLYGQPADRKSSARQSGMVTRKLRLLRAHGLIRKVPHTHRYRLSPQGQQAITALLAARQADIACLTKAA